MEVPRPSLFSTVTGAFRRRPSGVQPMAEPAAPAMRREPAPMESRPEAPRPSVRQTNIGDDVGLEIPAFLRRQSS
jgi:cell division protein FtsZ